MAGNELMVIEADVAEVDAEPKAVVPEGYETMEEFLSEVRRRFTEAVDADRENREAGMDDLRFLAGDQWDPLVRASRIAKKLPVMTINTLPQHVGQVVGDIRINKPAIKVRPAEGGDKKVAEIRQGLIRFIENKSNAQNVYALAGEDQVGGGLGHFRIGLEYAYDDTFDQDIRVRHIPDPFSVVWDPQSTDPTGADAQYCFVVDEMSRVAFEAAYPDANPSDLTLPTGDAGWVSRDIVRVTEYWVMKPKIRTLALLQRPGEAQPQIVDITGQEEANRQFIVMGADGRPRVRQALRHYACMYLTNGIEILEERPYELPLSRLPIIKVTAREVRVGPKRYRFGLVRWAKDPSRLKNIWRSSAAQWIGQAPKAQWLIQSSDEEERKSIEKASRNGASTIAYTGANPPIRLDPPTAPNALLQEAALSDQDIKDTTGLHSASLGISGNETSGKAINAREAQGDVATFMYHDNLHYAIREGGRVINDMIGIAYDAARTAVVLGEDGDTQTHRVNDPTAEEGLIDLKLGKYDIMLETGPSYSTRRAEAADSMVKFAQSVPQAAAIIGDILAEAQDWPMAEAIAKRLRKVLPPGMVDEEDKDSDELAGQGGQPGQGGGQPDPQAQAQAAQLEAAQRVQQAQAQQIDLELAEQAAKTKQAQAQADKAAADARKANAEAERAELELQLATAQVRRPLSFDDLTPEERAEAFAQA